MRMPPDTDFMKILEGGKTEAGKNGKNKTPRGSEN